MAPPAAGSSSLRAPLAARGAGLYLRAHRSADTDCPCGEDGTVGKGGRCPERMADAGEDSCRLAVLPALKGNWSFSPEGGFWVAQHSFHQVLTPLR